MSDLSSLFKPDLDRIKEKLTAGIEKDLKKLLRERVPVDTKTLQDEGLTVVSYSQGNEIVIDCFVNALNLSYQRQSIRADVLGLILNIGIRGNKKLLRTQSQPRNPARTPTEGWFSEDFINDVKIYLSEQKFMKWLN